VLSLRRVLACGAVGADPLSDRVAAVAAVPRGRDCGPWRTRAHLGGSDAARALAQRAISAFENLNLIDTEAFIIY